MATFVPFFEWCMLRLRSILATSTSVSTCIVVRCRWPGSLRHVLKRLCCEACVTHESLYLRNNSFPYSVFLAFSCPIFPTTRNIVPHFHVSHFYPCSFVPHFHVLHFYVRFFSVPYQKLNI